MKSNKAVKIVNFVTSTLPLWMISVFTVFTFVYLFYNSFRGRPDFLQNTFGVPQALSTDIYVKLFTAGKFLGYVVNSLYILVLTLAITIAVSSMVAYGIGRFEFKYKNWLMGYFLLGLMFPIQLSIIPVFTILQGLHLVNNLHGVILISAATISMPVLILTAFFAALPQSLYESAKLDGASEWTIFHRIMFPLASPVLFTASIIVSVGIWNQFFLPLVFLQSEPLKTIPLAIWKYSSKIISFVDYAFAAASVSTIPVIVLFLVFSQRIMDSVTAGAIKE